MNTFRLAYLVLDSEAALTGAIQKLFHLWNVTVITFLSNSPPLMSFTEKWKTTKWQRQTTLYQRRWKISDISILTTAKTHSYTNVHVPASSTGKEETDRIGLLINRFKRIMFNLFSVDNTNDTIIMGFFSLLSVVERNSSGTKKRNKWAVGGINKETNWVIDITFLIAPSPLHVIWCHLFHQHYSAFPCHILFEWLRRCFAEKLFLKF